MPRSSTLISSTPLGADAVAAAVSTVRMRLQDAGSAPEVTLEPVDGGAALTVYAGADLVLTVLRPRPLPDLTEVRRLRPRMTTDGIAIPAFWTDAYTPWTPPGLIGVAVLDELASASGVRVAHDPLR